MSFYDTVHCGYPLPDPGYQHEEFQTRDLGERMNRYLITKDGRLWRRRWGIHLFGQVEHPVHHDALEEAVPYHGDIRLSTTTAIGLREYVVRFTHGVLEWIRRADSDEPEPADSLQRLAWDAQRLELERSAQLETLLQRLEALDPEVAKEAVFVFNDRAEAARWLTSVHPELGNRSPYEELARGHRKEILNVLRRILHGIPT